MKKIIIIIVALLAIIIAIITITVGKVVQDKKAENIKAGDVSRDAFRYSTVKSIRTALELYFADHSASYPSGTNLILGKDLRALTASGFKKEASGETIYIDSIPANPNPGGVDYKYNCPGQPCTNYTLEFGLENSAANLGPGIHYITPESIN